MAAMVSPWTAMAASSTMRRCASIVTAVPWITSRSMLCLGCAAADRAKAAKKRMPVVFAKLYCYARFDDRIVLLCSGRARLIGEIPDQEFEILRVFVGVMVFDDGVLTGFERFLGPDFV